MSEPTRRLAAILFTDIVGFSALSQRDERTALELVEEQRILLRSFFPQFEVHEIKTIGDGFLLECPSTLQAVTCAIEIQRALHERNGQVPEDRRLSIRIGIHVGDIIHQDGDVLGDDVNVASRVEGFAESGGICVSEQVAAQVRHRLEYPLEWIGRPELKNITTPFDLYRVSLPWIESAPSPSTALRRSGWRSNAASVAIAVPALILLGGGGWWAIQKLSEMPPPATDSAAQKEGEEQAAESGEIRSVAVLPFLNLSADPANEYFSDGLTEELINSLASLEGIRVPARTSAFSFKNSTEDIRTIATKLNVDAILEGSVRKEGKQVRIITSLVDARKDQPLWNETYDRQIESVFAIQEDIAQHIVSALRMNLSGAEDKPLGFSGTANAEAFECYLRGRYHWNKRTEESFGQALQCFTHAVETDPEFALAYAGLADTYHLMERYEYLPEGLTALDARKKVRELADKALEMNPDIAQAHISKAVLLEYEWDWKGVEREYLRALQLEPANVQGLQWYATVLSKFGRWDEAIRTVERALELDPMSSTLRRSAGAIYLASGNTAKARTILETALAEDPDAPGARSYLSQVYALEGDFDRAIQVLDEEAARLGEDVDLGFERAHVYALAGNPDKVREILDQQLKQKQTPELAYWIGCLYFALNDFDQGFAHWEEAYAGHAFVLTHIKTIGVNEGVRKDPRYDDLVNRIGLTLDQETSG